MMTAAARSNPPPESSRRPTASSSSRRTSPSNTAPPLLKLGSSGSGSASASSQRSPDKQDVDADELPKSYSTTSRGTYHGKSHGRRASSRNRADVPVRSPPAAAAAAKTNEFAYSRKSSGNARNAVAEGGNYSNTDANYAGNGQRHNGYNNSSSSSNNNNSNNNNSISNNSNNSNNYNNSSNNNYSNNAMPTVEWGEEGTDTQDEGDDPDRVRRRTSLLDYNKIMGTFCIPTFKEDDESAAPPSPTSRRRGNLRNRRVDSSAVAAASAPPNMPMPPLTSRRRVGGAKGELSKSAMGQGAAPSEGGGNRFLSDRRMSDGRVLSSRTYQVAPSALEGDDAKGRERRKSSMGFDFEGGESSDEDNWMEDALLRGVPAANVGTGDTSGAGSGGVGEGGQRYYPAIRSILTAPSVEQLSASSDLAYSHPRLDASERSQKSMGSAPPRIGASGFQRRVSHDLQPEDALKHIGSDGSRKLSLLELAQITAYKTSNSDGMRRRGDGSLSAEFVSSQVRRTGREGRGNSNNDADPRQRPKYTASLEAMDEMMTMEPRRRRTLSNMANEEYALPPFVEEHFNNNSKNPSTLPPDALSNIPALPLVKTYKVIKRRHDEPAGLFLTKAKNGAVQVHSLSPESLFRGTNLVPGHEVLSVNEKRVNDPKMAATLITQARGGLALRASGGERPRGFLYCQVKRKGEAGGSGGGGGAHGLRFVTTSVDGVKRGNPGTDGLVRVSALDPEGLFAKSHPLNRLRVGSIVMTVNGAPISNGRKALEMVMGSRQLVEVLHCDERVWREDWLWDALEEAEGLKKKSLQEVMSRLFRREENAASAGEEGKSTRAAWNLEWNTERDEVTLSKKDVDWAFKLVFDNVAGTCHSQEVTEKMMPPTDEFDVSLFAQLVNDKQRTIMQVLQNMLSRAKFELQFASTSLRRSLRASNVVLAEPQAGIDGRFRRKMSYDGLHMMLMNDGDEEDDEEMSNLVNDLLRVDDRDRRRKSQGQDELRDGRRGSTGHIEALTAANFTAKDLEAWYLENMGKGVSNDDKIHWYHARRKKMEEHQENKMFKSDASNRSYASSMFSADMLEDYLDDLENFNDIHGGPPPSAENTEEDGSLTSTESSPPQSPRGDQKFEDYEVYTKSSNSLNSETEEKNPDEQNAYITGVFRDVASKYDVSDVVVGSGGFGEVRECNDKKTGKTYVVKTITKPPPDDTSKINLVRNEILLLHEAKHPNIVELKDLFEDSKYVHIVMERCTGGDLFDRVVNDNPARIRHRAEAMKHEARTANAMRSIMQVIKYLHSKGIVHRDIKPEHFLLTTDKKETQRIKLIDFGLARKHKPGSPPMTTFTGSPSFVAPEVIARSYDHMCDLFSTGVTAYFLLTGMLPFDGPSDEDTFDLISMGVFRFPSSAIHLSDDARDFVTRLLKTDPTKRMTAEEALDHPWLRKDASC